MSAPRLILKQPTGWFAAGREVAQALALLSDAAFKLYLYLCLQADRHTARLILDGAEVTKALGKDPAWIEDCLGELCRNKVCERCGGAVEICDRFWPYQKLPGMAAAAPEVEFVRQVRTAFLRPACVRSTFTTADEKLALNLYRREVSLEQVRWAIWLGCARKYMAMLNGQTRQPITSLAYFETLNRRSQAAPHSHQLLGACTAQNGGNGEALAANRKLATSRHCRSRGFAATRNALIGILSGVPHFVRNGAPLPIETAPHLLRNAAPLPIETVPHFASECQAETR